MPLALPISGDGTCPQCKAEGVKVWTCKKTQQVYCSRVPCQKAAGVPSRVNPPKRVKRDNSTECDAAAMSAAAAFGGATGEQAELRAELVALDQLLLQLQARRARVHQLLERCTDADADDASSAAAVLVAASATTTNAAAADRRDASSESPEEDEDGVQDGFAAAAAAYSAPRLPVVSHSEVVRQIEALIRPTGSMTQVCTPTSVYASHTPTRSRVHCCVVCTVYHRHSSCPTPRSTVASLLRRSRPGSRVVVRASARKRQQGSMGFCGRI
jgi:hypothetical protein